MSAVNAASPKSSARSSRFSFRAVSGIGTDGNARIVPSAANITVRAPSNGGREMNADSSLTSKSTVVTARSAPVWS